MRTELARDLYRFVKEYDPYEYMDICDDESEDDFIETFRNELFFEPYISYLEDFEEEEARELIERLREMKRLCLACTMF